MISSAGGSPYIICMHISGNFSACIHRQYNLLLEVIGVKVEVILHIPNISKTKLTYKAYIGTYFNTNQGSI